MGGRVHAFSLPTMKIAVIIATWEECRGTSGTSPIPVDTTQRSISIS